MKNNNKKNKEFKSSYSTAIRVIAGICALLIVGTLFLSLLH